MPKPNVNIKCITILQCNIRILRLSYGKPCSHQKNPLLVGVGMSWRRGWTCVVISISTIIIVCCCRCIVKKKVSVETGPSTSGRPVTPLGPVTVRRSRSLLEESSRWKAWRKVGAKFGSPGKPGTRTMKHRRRRLVGVCCWLFRRQIADSLPVSVAEATGRRAVLGPGGPGAPRSSDPAAAA